MTRYAYRCICGWLSLVSENVTEANADFEKHEKLCGKLN